MATPHRSDGVCTSASATPTPPPIHANELPTLPAGVRTAFMSPSPTDAAALLAYETLEAAALPAEAATLPAAPTGVRTTLMTPCPMDAAALLAVLVKPAMLEDAVLDNSATPDAAALLA